MGEREVMRIIKHTKRQAGGWQTVRREEDIARWVWSADGNNKDTIEDCSRVNDESEMTKPDPQEGLKARSLVRAREIHSSSSSSCPSGPLRVPLVRRVLGKCPAVTTEPPTSCPAPGEPSGPLGTPYAPFGPPAPTNSPQAPFGPPKIFAPQAPFGPPKTSGPQAPPTTTSRRDLCGHPTPITVY
ncbi:proline-rich proteoglycan 2-like [Homarus americanus]|uniref:proline-rich proteoglycan 2-like n=1 Tax=Homarus americanus TaxID=6706 RepID=UPI001C43C699|nr:proline-rich proteoglycan 2-like [Homarus americanus]